MSDDVVCFKIRVPDDAEWERFVKEFNAFVFLPEEVCHLLILGIGCRDLTISLVLGIHLDPLLGTSLEDEVHLARIHLLNDGAQRPEEHEGDGVIALAKPYARAM